MPRRLSQPGYAHLSGGSSSNNRNDDLSSLASEPIPRKPVPYTSTTAYQPVSTMQSFEIGGPPQRMPSRLQNPQSNRSWLIMVFIGDTLLTALPLLFLTLAFFALSVDNQPVSERGRRVQAAARLGPSIFPILFAAVVGRLMRTMALWRAERGSTLGVLEQLNGSQNLLAAFERAAVIQGLGYASILVVLLWCLSPLGGQSSLRVVGTKLAFSPGLHQVYYFNTTAYESSMFLGADDLSSYKSPADAVYQAALLAPNKVQSSTVDIWNNVKIPMMEYLDGYREDGSWYNVNGSGNLTYSSLTGLMVVNLNSSQSSNFTAESSYFNLNCSAPIHFVGNDSASFNDLAQFYGGLLEYLGPLVFHHNTSEGIFVNPGDDNPDDSWMSFMIDTSWNYTRDPSGTPNLVYASQGAGDGNYWAFKCNVTTSRVESNILCNGTDCYVNRMRRSVNDTAAPTATPWNNGDFVYFANFLDWFPWTAGSIRDEDVSPTDAFVGGSNTPFSVTDAVTDPGYSGTTARSVSQRLSSAVNTVWQASIANTAIALQSSEPFNITALATGDSFAQYANTTAQTQSPGIVYDASKPWIAMTVIISATLFACGVAGQAFKYISRAPDILGYVSTMTRDNPWFEGPNPGSDIDGLQRARHLRHVQVQIANVKPWDEKGHIALTSVHGNNKDWPVHPL